MPGHLLLKNCLEDEVTRPAIERALTKDTLLWLDLPDTSPDTLAPLSEVFKIHPLAVEEGSLGAFLIFGLGTELAAVAGLLFMFRRRGWL